MPEIREIQWDARGYNFGGRPGFLISGEFHYFRVPRDAWAERLDLLISAGGQCVATYVPWILHEPSEGDFRIGDKPCRDLDGFLELCGQKGLRVICRPGPYQYSEMRYCGLPAWLCEGYPEILARNARGERLHDCSASYMHPVFLEKARKWFAFICPAIARHTVSRGGPVAFVQLDNELMGIHEWFGGWDYSTDGMGTGAEDGPYARFLAERYGNLENVNAAYGTARRSMADVRPWGGTEGGAEGGAGGSMAPANEPGGQAPGRADPFAALRMAKDYQDFYFARAAEYLRLLADWAREFGIGCALVHNSANGSMNPYFLETAATMRAERDFLLGCDLYYTFHMDSGANNPTPQLAAKALLAHETLRLMGFPPTVFELQAGNCMDWPPVAASDLRCWYLLNLAFGMKGLNYYVFAGGYNPDGIGGDGDLYDYRAGVGPAGEIRAAYGAQKEFGAFLAEHGWLAAAERECDVYLGLDWEQARSKYYDHCHDRPLPDFSAADAWEFLRKGLLFSLLCGSRAPELADLADDGLPGKTDKPLLVATSERMSAKIQRNLARYVERGGRLLLAPVIPSLDENYRPCAILGEALGGAACRPAKSGGRNVCGIGGLANIPLDGLWEAARMPEGARVLLRDMPGPLAQAAGAPQQLEQLERDGYVPEWASGAPRQLELTRYAPQQPEQPPSAGCAPHQPQSPAPPASGERVASWLWARPGGGAVLWLGASWRFQKAAQLALLDALLCELGAPAPAVRCDSPYVWAVLRSDGARQMLFLMNLFASSQAAAIQVRAGACASGAYEEVGTFLLAPMEIKILAKEGRLWRERAL
ncbi:MAG: beta-galactosidase [Clostridiales bacterium]|jgi:beta-galactosidase|nr:beta-galactosidase [Clostridiales bacterium]